MISSAVQDGSIIHSMSIVVVFGDLVMVGKR